MSREERMQLLADRTFLKRLMERTPAKARLTIMSDKHRLRQIEERLASLPPPCCGRADSRCSQRVKSICCCCQLADGFDGKRE